MDQPPVDFKVFGKTVSSSSQVHLTLELTAEWDIFAEGIF